MQNQILTFQQLHDCFTQKQDIEAVDTLQEILKTYLEYHPKGNPVTSEMFGVFKKKKDKESIYVLSMLIHEYLNLNHQALQLCLQQKTYPTLSQVFEKFQNKHTSTNQKESRSHALVTSGAVDSTRSNNLGGEPLDILLNVYFSHKLGVNDAVDHCLNTKKYPTIKQMFEIYEQHKDKESTDVLNQLIEEYYEAKSVPTKKIKSYFKKQRYPDFGDILTLFKETQNKQAKHALKQTLTRYHECQLGVPQKLSATNYPSIQDMFELFLAKDDNESEQMLKTCLREYLN